MIQLYRHNVVLLYLKNHIVSFAGSKGKEMGLTDRELSILYNSSYIICLL